MREVIHSFLNAILNAMNDALTAIDEQGTVVYWNRAAEEMYGIPKEAIVGRNVNIFFKKNSLMLSEVLRSGIPVYRVYHKPRADKHVLINAVPVHDGNGELVGAVSVERDITSLVHLSEQRRGENQCFPCTEESTIIRENSHTVEALAKLVVEANKNGRNYPFLLVGETGVGRRAMAEFIHKQLNTTGDFSILPCEVLPPGFVEHELFGYEGDMFGDPSERRPGYLEQMRQGTLYLTNVQKLPISVQHRLFYALRDQRFYRIGGNKPIQLDCLVLASAPPGAADLLVNELYYEFHVLSVPPLRERQDELMVLFSTFLRKAAAETGRSLPSLSPEAVVALSTYDWPGNISELKNTAEHIILSTQSHEVLLQDLPSHMHPKTLKTIVQQLSDLNSLSREIERDRILSALRETEGNKTDAARALGISRGTLYYKLKKLGI